MKLNSSAFFVVALVIVLTGVVFFPIKLKANVGVENPPQVVNIPGVQETVKQPDTFNIDGNMLTAQGYLTEADREEAFHYYQQRGKNYAKQVRGEIFRKWKNGIEVNKFKNGLLMERAGAPVTVVNTSHHHNVEAVRVQPTVQE